jgi:hypothetical protein
MAEPVATRRVVAITADFIADERVWWWLNEWWVGCTECTSLESWSWLGGKWQTGSGV